MNYKYRLLKTSWGIAIDIDIEVKENISTVDYEIININSTLNLAIKKSLKLLDEEIHFLEKGLKDAIPYIFNDLATEKNVCIENTIINFAHYQEEGLYCAIQEALALYYKVDIPKISTSYDKENNKYVFDIT